VTIEGGRIVVMSRLALGSLGTVLLLSVTLSPLAGVRSARAFPPDQVARGEAVFNAICLECHGPDSTNLDAPLLLRPDSLRRFPNAAAAHAFVSREMPSESPGSLTPDEYWDVVAFLLAQSGIGAGDAPLGPETAAATPTRGQGGTRGPGAGSSPPAAPPEAPPAQDTPAAEPPAPDEGE
jgi:mono/diheme cytochrome c family protein